MIRTVLKYALLAGVAFVCYKGLQFHAALKMAEHLDACGFKARVCPLVHQKADGTAITQAMNDAFRCVDSRQSFAESLVLPMKGQLSAPANQHFDHEQAGALCGP